MSSINRIILIGNGFDLAHDLKTRYEDFIYWYWDKILNNLRLCYRKTYFDKLCTLKINNDTSVWSDFWWNVFNTSHYPTGKEFYESITESPEDFTFEGSVFLKKICQSIETKGWVDIENEYFVALKNEYFKNPQSLNDEFDVLKSNLCNYLNKVQNSKIHKFPEIGKTIFDPIRPEEIATDKQVNLIDFIRDRIHHLDPPNNPIQTCLGEFSREDRLAINSFLKKYKDPIDHFGIESIIKLKNIPDALLYPDRIMLLNFNYTDIADRYEPDNIDDYRFSINHIHGKLSDSLNHIIFGYGDEMDNTYKEIAGLNNNEYLQNIKSVKYLETDNYRNMLSFLNSAPYQVYIMGHSCGISDRVLLNTIFEHDNCISIKPFYYINTEDKDNYLELVQNISRNFTDMKLMRDRVVNKSYCKALKNYNSDNQ